ncbi:MAG: sugar ABC transporter permease [Defluviitaleaceae bacterium]|nr:sugar ABC transporter permease [Defluviitaleaceae bacterium]
MVRRIFNHENAIYLLLLPSLAGLALFFLVPFGISMFYASVDNVVSRQFVGINNLVNTWNNLAFQLAMRNTLTFMGVSIPLIMALALLLALLVRPVSPRARRLLMVFFLLPLVIPSGSMVFFWRALISVNGMINRMFFTYDGTAMPTDWLNSPHALWFVIGIFIWKNAGFNMILFQAGLDFIPKDYYEYASIEGAGKLRQFRIVTLTYLGPTFLLVFILSVVNSFKVFREIYLLTGTHPNHSIYLLQHFLNNQFANLNYQLMASASFFTFGFIFILVLGMYWLQQRQTYI